MKQARIFLTALVCALLAVSCTSSDSADSDVNAATSPGIAGSWVLTALTIEGSNLSVPEDVQMKIEAGRISGSVGCNTFGGMLETLDDGGLQITEMSQTELACEDEQRMMFESEYGAALSSATSWKPFNDGIQLNGDLGTMLYEPAPAAPDAQLAGTVWVFDTVFSGDGPDRTAASSDRSATPATLTLTSQSDGAVGMATLKASDCDDVSFEINFEEEGGTEGNVSVPEVASPSRCESPNLLTAFEGVSKASGFMIVGDQLTLIGEPGELVGFRAEQ